MMVLVAILALPLAVLAGAKEEHGEVTVQGEILDMACYLSKGAKGEEHSACAKKCVKGGQPMGLLGSDGQVYLLAGHEDSSAFDQAKDYAGKKVEIEGKELSGSGLKIIEVYRVKAL